MGRINSDVRHQLVLGAADLISRRGLRASTVRDLAHHARTPEGSTYHYFPGGKQELAAEAVRLRGELVHQAVGQALEKDPLAGLRVLFEVMREMILRTQFQGGCPVLAVAVEGYDGHKITPALRAAGEVFGRWELQLAQSLERHGLDEDQSKQIGTLIWAATEGAVAMCRAKQSIKPFDNVAKQLQSMVQAVLSLTCENLTGTTHSLGLTEAAALPRATARTRAEIKR